MRNRACSLLLLGLLIGSPTWAKISPAFKNVNYDDQYMSVESFILGRTCYSLRASAVNLNCNPAFMAGQERNELSMQLNLDDNFSEVYGYSRDLKNHEASSVIGRILKDPKPLTANEVAATWWQHDWWALSITPLRLAIANVVSNPAYPTVYSHVSFQRELSARAGLFVAEDTHFRVGANLRYIESHQFREQFALFDALAGAVDVKVKESDIVYLEPAMSYAWDSAWESEVSLVVTHLRLYESKKNIPDLPRPEIGYSSSPDFLGKKLRTSIHYTSRPDVTNIADRIRFGGIYEFSKQFSTSFSLAGDEYGIGVMGSIDSVVLGLGLKSEVFHLNGDEIDRVTTMMFQAGLTF